MTYTNINHLSIQDLNKLILEANILIKNKSKPNKKDKLNISPFYKSSDGLNSYIKMDDNNYINIRYGGNSSEPKTADTGESEDDDGWIENFSKDNLINIPLPYNKESLIQFFLDFPAALIYSSNISRGITDGDSIFGSDEEVLDSDLNENLVLQKIVESLSFDTYVFNPKQDEKVPYYYWDTEYIKITDFGLNNQNENYNLKINYDDSDINVFYKDSYKIQTIETIKEYIRQLNVNNYYAVYTIKYLDNLLVFLASIDSWGYCMNDGKIKQSLSLLFEIKQ